MCNPNVRTIFCGKPGCVGPGQDRLLKVGNRNAAIGYGALQNQVIPCQESLDWKFWTGYWVGAASVIMIWIVWSMSKI